MLPGGFYFHQFNSNVLFYIFRLASNMDSQNERNFLLLQRLVLDSTRVLRVKFDSFVPASTFKTWLPRDKDLKKAKLSEAQIHHMKQNPDSSKFDISLLISLLRHFCYKSDLKHPLWNETDNNKMLPSMTGDIANIVRIRNLRNKVSVYIFTRLLYYPYTGFVLNKCIGRLRNRDFIHSS